LARESSWRDASIVRTASDSGGDRTISACRQKGRSLMPRPVIVISGKDPRNYGGMGSYLRAYGRAAIANGYRPHFFCASDRTLEEETEFGTVHRAWSPFRPFRGLMLAGHQPFITAGVERFASTLPGPQLIHSFGPWAGVGVAAARRLRRRGREAVAVVTPFSTYHHETLAKARRRDAGYTLFQRVEHQGELLWTRLTVSPSERSGFAGSRMVFVNYDSVRAIIEAQFGGGIRFGKMTYCSEAAFTRQGTTRAAPPGCIAALEPRDAPLLVCVSRHDARKGIDVLLRALATLRRQGVPFRACLVGGGSLLQSHRRLAVRLELGPSTAIVGWATDSYGYLEQADLFVLPSLEEGSGSVALLEAMQAGVAPVVSRVDGIPEDVDHGEHALLVEPGAPAALAAAIATLLSNEAMRRRLARAARQRYLDRFSAAAFIADLRENYTRLGFPPT
jgi:glycosyltransferase involved in cell wall biosynthesis